MNIVIWALAGALLGWASFSYLNYNEARGKLVSIAIGAVGALVGGNVIAPMFAAQAAQAAPVAFSASALVVAGIAAAVCLVVGNLVYTRWGV